MAELREQVAAGIITRDSMRVLLGSMRPGAAGETGAAPAEGRQGAPTGARQRGDRAQGGSPAEGGRDRSQGQPDARVAIVFVVLEDGTIEPRPVRLGLGDWDQVAVLSGLEEGDQVAIIGAAQLQAQQAEFLNRMRDRAGGNPFGGGRR